MRLIHDVESSDGTQVFIVFNPKTHRLRITKSVGIGILRIFNQGNKGIQFTD